MKKDLIVRGEKNIRKFYLSKNLNLNEFSQKDWMFKNGSSIGEHVFFCTNQETINKQLKSVTGAGLLTLNNACRVLQNFKCTYIKLHERCIVKGLLNRKRPVPLAREQSLSEILNNFL